MLGGMRHTPLAFTSRSASCSPIARPALLAGLVALALAAPASAQPPGDGAGPDSEAVRVRIPSGQERLRGFDIRSHGPGVGRASRIRVHGVGREPEQIRYHGSGGVDDPSRIRVRGLGREAYFAIRSHWMGDGVRPRGSSRSRIRTH